MVEPHSSNFRVITTNILGVRIFRKFTVNIGTPEIIAVIILKLNKVVLAYNNVSKDVEGMANSVDRNQTAPIANS